MNEETNIPHSIYFIESHQTNQVYNSPYIEKFDETNPPKIELIKEKISTEENSLNVISKIYKFMVNKIDIKFEITVLIEDTESNNKFEKKIVYNMVKTKNTNIFLYNFNFQLIEKENYNEIQNFLYSPSSNFFELSEESQFHLYLEDIESKYKDLEKEKENIIKDLILSTQNFCLGKEKQYDFLFYLTIFNLCYKTDLINRLLLSFKPERIIKIGNIKNDKINDINELKYLINSISSNPEPISKILYKKEKYRLYNLIFYFNYNFQTDKINLMLDNININIYLYKFIAANSHFLPNLKVSLEKINDIIKECTTLDEIKNIFFYYNDCYDILYIIAKNKEFIFEKYNKKINLEEKQNNKHAIILEDYIQPKEKDDLKKIYALIKEIIEFQKKESSKFVVFSVEILKKYLALSEGTNYCNLCIIQDIYYSIKESKPSFVLNDFDFKFHKNGVNFIERKKLNNIEVLDFIERDEYLKKSNLYSLFGLNESSILKGINLSDIDDIFIQKWKNIDWLNIFKDKFFEIIYSLVEDISQISNLLKLLHYIKTYEIYRKKIFKNIQKVFIEKGKNELPQKLNDNIDIITDIIKESDISQVNIKDFLEKIIKGFNQKFILNLFINVLSKEENNLYEETKEFIKGHILTQIKFGNKNNILHIIKIIIEKKCNILKDLKNYILKKEEFFLLEESVELKLKILELFITHKIIFDKKIRNPFLKQTNEIIETIKKKINDYDLMIDEIKDFFINENNKKIFFQRYALLYLKIIKIEDINIFENTIVVKGESKRNIDDKFEENINKIINKIYSNLKTYNENQKSLKKIMSYLYNFNNEYQKEIIKLIIFIEKYSNTKLKNLENEEIKNYKDKYLKKALRKEELNQSILFNSIYENTKNRLNVKNEVEQIFFEAIKTFEEKKNVLNENMSNIDEKTIKGITNIFKEKNDEEIKEEIEKLKNLYQINKFNDDSLINNLTLLLKKENIINICSLLRNFIEKMEVKKEKFYQNLYTIILFNSKNIGKSIINMSADLLNCFGDDLISPNNFIYILKKFAQNNKALDFLIGKSFEDCRILQEIVNDSDDNFINADDLFHFEKCVEFMNKIRDKNELNQLTDYKLIQRAINLSKNKDLLFYFENYINHSEKISEIYNKELDKSEIARQKIKDICKDSIFILSNKNKNYFDGNYKREEAEQKENMNNKNESIDTKYQKIEINELQELKERIQISRAISIDMNNQNVENEQLFIELITDINKINSLLNEIYIKGYTKEIEVKISVKNSKKIFEFIKENKEYNEKEKNDDKFNEKNRDIIKDSHLIIYNLKLLLEEIKSNQKNGYKEKIYIRYIYGRQFNTIYHQYLKNIQKNIKTNKDDIPPFLQYITNNELKKKLNRFDWKDEKNEFKTIINNLNNYIKKSLNINGISLEKIYAPSIIQKKFNNENYKGFYLYYCEKIEKEIFQLYKYLTGNIPIAQNVLLCNKETSKEEIESFLYRAILCKFHSCFIIGGIESLEFIPNNHLIELLKILLIKNEKKMNSCLIIFSANKDSDTAKRLDSIEFTKHFEDKNIKEISSYNLDNNNNIIIISSDVSGIGKSTKIEHDILIKNKKYKYFPLGGVFTREKIIKRLRELEINGDSAIHLDLYDTENIDLMQDFLFSIIITKLYRQNEEIICLPKDIEIKIEIPNGFINYLEKFPILTLIPRKEEHKMKISKLEPLIIYKDVTSNVQIVCNYLKLRKNNTLNDKDLDFPGITPDGIRNNKEKKTGFKTIIPAESLLQKECQFLVFDILQNLKNEKEKFSYYQINSFIDVLSVQLKKFTQSYYFNAYDLSSKNNLKNIRTFIIDSFIKLTKYFTEGAFTNLIHQNINHKIIFGQYNEREDIKEGINNLAKNDHYKISFDKIDPSLVFFHEGDNPFFSIITNKTKDDDEYQKFLYLKNCQKLKGEEIDKELTDYKKYDQLSFLKELKKILNLDNPITKKEKEEEKRKKEKEKEKEENRKKEKNNKKDKKNENVKKNEKDLKAKEEEKKGKEELLSLEEIADNYVFTADNFVKMILILIRIKSNVPVIMMGETGCGKTSLIKKLSELLNNGSNKKMEILNIHAGINDDEIINFIKKINEKSKKLEEEEKSRKINYAKYNKYFEEKKLWVFLDEINTCKSMGLISELICKHSCQGTKLNYNIVFIAACNPYRLIEDKKQTETGLNIKDAHKEKEKLNEKERKELENQSLFNKKKLVYTVNPLPHSLLNFVFDFGSLDRNDEEKYIENMIQGPIERIFKENNKDKLQNDKLEEIKKLAKDMISKSQNFIRDKNDVSSVSLREIRRFVIFYEFFYKYLKYKKEKFLDLIKEQINENKIKFKYGELTEFDYQIYAINLSIFICYYLRITDKEMRKELLNELNSIFKEKYGDFLELPVLEEHFIADNIEKGKGIAKNKVLLENIFSLFCCINNKIPIFIVGKPGCSKSLSVQLINKAMIGSNSKNPLFGSLPRIIMHCYQGSLGSTSEGVLKIFKKAQNSFDKQKEEFRKQIIPMIFFDEMGLAEHSPNNPLKVIHSQLEFDDNKESQRVAFVGISNWVLDASKMNRGIHISIPELDEEDNKNTALTIAESYGENLAIRFKHFFESLGETFYLYKQYLNDNHNLDGKNEFHGNRDFYHFVKIASSKISSELKDNKNLEIEDKIWEIGLNSIERNFGGLSSSVEIIKEKYKKFYPNCIVNKKYDVLKCIKKNRKDPKSRYLLLISKSTVSFHLLSSIFGENKYNFFIGSRFSQDLKSEEYQFKMINKIQIYMEQGETIILKDLESVFPALYDVFNQNFTVVGERNYARISIGPTINHYSYVNENFKCIVDVDSNKIDQQETPFLNRFEKHIISFESLLNEELIKESERIHKIIKKDLIQICKNYKIINYDIEKLLINCELEEIQGLIFQASKKGITAKNMINEVMSKISLTLPQDIIFLLINNNNFEYRDLILEYYNKGEHSSFPKFLKHMKNRKNIIYTFSHDYNFTEENEEINNDNLDIKFKISDNIKNIKIKGIKSENELEKRIDNFLEDENYIICLLEFNPNEGEILNYIKFFIENREKEKKNFNKIFIFVVHMIRLFYKELEDYDKKSEKIKKTINSKILKETLSNLSDYYQIFIDNLNGKEDSLKNIIESDKDKDKLLDYCLDLDLELKQNIYNSLTYIKYEKISDKLNKDNYIDELITFIRHDNNKNIRKLINDCIKDKLLNKEKILEKLFEENKKEEVEKNTKDEIKELISDFDIDMLSIIKKFLTKLYQSQLNIFYFNAENDNFFSPLLYIYSQEEYKNIISEIDLIKEENNEKNEDNNDIKIKIIKTIITKE